MLIIAYKIEKKMVKRTAFEKKIVSVHTVDWLTLKSLLIKMYLNLNVILKAKPVITSLCDILLLV